MLRRIDFLCTDKLDGGSVDVVIEHLRSGKGLSEIGYMRSFFVKEKRQIATDNRFRLLNIF